VLVADSVLEDLRFEVAQPLVLGPAGGAEAVALSVIRFSLRPLRPLSHEPWLPRGRARRRETPADVARFVAHKK
jgi:hypothetical protein